MTLPQHSPGGGSPVTGGHFKVAEFAIGLARVMICVTVPQPEPPSHTPFFVECAA